MRNKTTNFLGGRTRRFRRERPRIALFDFDGTLSKGFISMDFLDWLFEHKIYPADFYRQQMKILKDYQAKKISYEKWCDDWGLLWARGLEGQRVSVVKKSARTFFKTFRANIYPSSYKLIKILKERGYHSLILATGASEVVDLAGDDLGIDEAHATKIVSRGSIYLARLATDFHKRQGKKDFMEKLTSSGKYDMEKSLAFGDSPHDVGMLKKVEIPVALNPHEELRRLARKNGWLISDYNNVVRQVNNLISRCK